MKKLYTLEIYYDEKTGFVAHEKADLLNAIEARVIASYLAEYHLRILNYLIVMSPQSDAEQKPKKAE